MSLDVSLPKIPKHFSCRLEVVVPMSYFCKASSFPSRTCITGLVLQHCCKTRFRFFVVHFSVSSLSFKFSQECSPLRVYINLTFTLYFAPWALLSFLLLSNLPKCFIQNHGWLSCSVLGRRVAELELYILVCKVCVVDAQCFVVRSF